jgi:hypothetical protein
MPMVTCPTCEQEFQWDDYYDVTKGHTRDCPHCTNECEVIEVDQVTIVSLQGMREAEQRGARPEDCRCTSGALQPEDTCPHHGHL